MGGFDNENHVSIGFNNAELLGRRGGEGNEYNIEPGFRRHNRIRRWSWGGWTFVNDAGSFLNSGAQGGYVNEAGNGNFGTVEQTVNTIIGANYEIDFFLTGNGVNSGDLAVSFGADVGFSTSTPVTPGIYTEYSFDAKATQSTTLFMFAGTNLGGTTWINDVSVIPLSSGVPEPSTWALLALGFAGLGFAGYRKTKRERNVPAPV